MSAMQSFFPSLLVAAQLFSFVNGQTQAVQYNQVVNINGDMQLNSLTFPDNSKIETYSQKQQQILVNQNPSPLTANHVLGSTGGPFVQLSQNSMTIATNGATDLVGAQIEFAVPQATLDQNGVSSDNMFVAMLAPDRQAWIVMESVKSVNITDGTVRMVKMTNIDGEYMAVGRKTAETSTVLSPFTAGLTQKSTNVTGSGIQEIEYADGFRMSIKASQPMVVSANVVNGVSSSMTNGIMPVNNYRYFVQSNLAGVTTNLNQMMTVVQLPLNAARVMTLATQMGATMNSTVTLAVAQRSVLQNPGGVGGNQQLQPQKRQKSSSSSRQVAKATSKAASKTSKAASKTKSASSATSTPEAMETPASEETPAEAPAEAPSEETPKATSKAGSKTKSATSSKPTETPATEATPETASEEPAAPQAASEATTSEATTSEGAPASNGTTTAEEAPASPSPSSTGASVEGATTPAEQPAAPAPNAPAQQQPSSTTNNGISPQAAQLLLSPTFTPVAQRTVLDMASGRVAVTISQLDGELILSMSMGGATTASAAGEGAGGKAPAGVAVTMAELAVMAQMQRTGSMMSVSEMMNEMMTQSQASAPRPEKREKGFKARSRRW